MTAVATEPNATRSSVKPGDAPKAQLREIPLNDLRESPWNPREHFDPAALTTLAESLKTQGQLDPIVVRPTFNGTNASRPVTAFEIGAGHRRFRAAQNAGLTTLLAVVRELDDVAFLELLVFENGNRNDLQPLEEAAGYKMLMEQAGYDVPRIAERDGRSIKYVYDRIKLLHLIPDAKKLLREGTISAGHAIILARLTPTDQKRAIGDSDEVGSYSMNASSGGIFRPEMVDGELELKGGDLGVRSVRELQQWVHDNVRFIESYADPVLFPDTFETLGEAHQSADKVVHITHDHAVSDGARDPNMRTYGYNCWKRADGHRGSKKCDRSVIGLVVAGDHQGDAFRVCVNKNRCKVHWKTEATTYEKRQKAAKKAAKSAAGTKTREPSAAERAENEEVSAASRRQQERNERITEARDAELTKAFERRLPEFVAGTKARMKQLAGVPDDVIKAIVDGDFWPQPTRKSSDHRDEIQDLVQPELPGKWSGKGSSAAARDSKAMRADIALSLYIALDTDGLDETLEREADRGAAKVVAALEAEDKAKAKEKEENADLLGHALGKLNAERRAAKKRAKNKKKVKK